MPNIREYDSPINSLQPNNIGATAMARAATRLGVLGGQEAEAIDRSANRIKQAGDAIGNALKVGGKLIDDIETDRDQSKFNAELMKTHEALDKDWTKTRANTDLGKPASEDWRSQAFPQLDKLMDSMGTERGRKYAEAHINRAKEHYITSTVGDDAAAAGDAAVRNLQVVVSGATVRSTRDPSTIEYNGQIIKNTIDEMVKSGSLSTREQLKIRDAGDKAIKENNVAGLKGMADRNPAMFMDQMKSGVFDSFGLDARANEQLLHYAQVQKHMKGADAKRNARQAETATKAGSTATRNDYMQEMIDPDTGDFKKMPNDMAQRIMNDPNLLEKDKITTLKTIAAAGRAAPKADDLETRNYLERRLKDPDEPLDASEIADARAAGKITPRTAADLSRGVNRLNTAEGRERNQYESGARAQLKSEIMGNSLLPIPAGAPKVFEDARLKLHDYIKTQRDAGTPDAEIFGQKGKAYWGNQPWAKNSTRPSSVQEMVDSVVNPPKPEPKGLSLPPRVEPPKPDSVVRQPPPKKPIGKLFEVGDTK